MVIGVLTARLAVYGSMSLKDKRRVVKSLKERIHHRFNASIAETGGLDSRQSAVLSAAVVSNETQHVESCLQQIVNFMGGHRGATLVDYDIEIL